MANIILPEPLRAFLGPEMKMDTHWIDVRLTDGRVFRAIMVRGGVEITGRGFHPIDSGPLPFEASDIAEIRPWSMLLPIRWWLSRAKHGPRRSLAVSLALAVLALAAIVIAHERLAPAAGVTLFVVAVLVGLLGR